MPHLEASKHAFPQVMRHPEKLAIPRLATRCFRPPEAPPWRAAVPFAVAIVHRAASEPTRYLPPHKSPIPRRSPLKPSDPLHPEELLRRRCSTPEAPNLKAVRRRLEGHFRHRVLRQKRLRLMHSNARQEWIRDRHPTRHRTAVPCWCAARRRESARYRDSARLRYWTWRQDALRRQG